MRSTFLALHVLGGTIGILAGFTALALPKGAGGHRRAGLAFTGAMLLMCAAGFAVAALKGQVGNMIAATLTGYLVLTATITMRPPTPTTRRIELAAMLAAFLLAPFSIDSGLATLASGRFARNGVPWPMPVLFGTVLLLAALGDLRVRRAGGVAGVPRLRRHLWRMCWALWIAAMSFFVGQAHRFPEPLRIYPLLALPGTVALVAMGWWAWRVGRRPRQARGAPIAAPGTDVGRARYDAASSLPETPAPPAAWSPWSIPSRSPAPPSRSSPRS